MNRIYLDHNATTRPSDAAMKEMLRLSLELYGNPSSLHWAGAGAKDVVEEARRRVAALVGARPSEVVFTGGGTESDVNAVHHMVVSARAKHPARTPVIAWFAVEHPAVRATIELLESQKRVKGIKINALSTGQPDLAQLEEVVQGGMDGLCLMCANNETGIGVDLDAVGALLEGKGILWHCDIVQSAGKTPISLSKAGRGCMTSAAMAAHKLHGPKGVGALWVRRGVSWTPLLPGGAQEGGRRSGTLNVAGIAAFGIAAREAKARLEQENAVEDLRDHLERGLLRMFPGSVVYGEGQIRLPNTCAISIQHADAWIEGSRWMFSLSERGIAVSTGAACASSSRKASHTLTEMGVSPEQGRAMLRFSLGFANTREEIDEVLRACAEIAEES